MNVEKMIQVNTDNTGAEPVVIIKKVGSIFKESLTLTLEQKEELIKLLDNE